jgi:hypothetical protein
LTTDPSQIDSLVGVLMELVKRDEKLEGNEKLNLGDKLVKWASSEGEKAASPTRSYVHV